VIHVERGQVPAPFKATKMAEERRRLAQLYAPGGRLSEVEAYQFKPLRQFDGVSEAVGEHFNLKCAYCETVVARPQSVPDPLYLEDPLPYDASDPLARERAELARDRYPIGGSRFTRGVHTPEFPRLMYAGLSGDFELNYFRPVSGVIGLDGKFIRPGYWWLAYEWENVYLSCLDCAKLKGNKFPVEGQRPRHPGDGRTLSREKALLLDPCADHPEEHLVFNETGIVASETTKGRTTIDVLGLNRLSLVEARAKVVTDLIRFRISTLDEDAPVIHRRGLYDPSMPHLAVRRQFLQQWSAEALARRPYLKPLLEEFLSFRTALNFAQKKEPAPAKRAAKKSTKESTKRAAKKPVKPPDKKAAAKTPTAETINQFLRVAEIESKQLLDSRAKAEEELRKRILDSPDGKALVELRKLLLDSQVKTAKELQKKILKEYLSFKSEQESYSVEKEARGQKRAYHAQTRFIERVVIHNFKVIGDLELEFPPLRADEGSWLMLLGENGTGKSTILEAVALTLMGERARRAAKHGPRECLRYGEDSGHVKVFLTGSLEPIELHFSRGSNRFEFKPDAEPKILLLGYGATRLLPRRGHKPAPSPKASKTENLFDPFIPLSDATGWLYDLPKKVFDRMEEGLKQLLLLGDGDRFVKRRNARRIEIEAFGARTPLDDLSDGYQSVLALAADIMSVMRLRWKETPMSLVEGIVLVDEIDAHLHPRWKMRIVERLRKVLPRLQFLVTSHDPLCLRGLHEGEVVVMQRHEKNGPYAIKKLPAPDALRIDQILTSDYFGLNTTIDPETEELFEEYYNLLVLRSPTTEQKRRVAQIRGRLKRLELMGTTRRERLVLEAADRYLARRESVTDEDERLRLDDEAKEELARMWKALG